MFIKKISFVIIVSFLVLIPTLVHGATKSNDVIVSADKTVEPIATDYKTQTFKEKINKNMPEYTFALTYYEDLKLNTIVLTTLKITDKTSGKLIQEISIPELTLKGQTFIDITDPNKGLDFMDLNFDGYRDIRILDIRNIFGSDKYIYFVWNPCKGLFENDKNLNIIPNAVFDEKNQEIYGTLDYNGLNTYSSTFKYINGILTPVRYFSKEYIGNTAEEINQSLEKISMNIDLSNSIGYREKVSALDLKTGEMKVISDNVVFYTQYNDSGQQSKEIARFNANSKEGKAILETKFNYPFNYNINLNTFSVQ